MALDTHHICQRNEQNCFCYLLFKKIVEIYKILAVILTLNMTKESSYSWKSYRATYHCQRMTSSNMGSSENCSFECTMAISQRKYIFTDEFLLTAIGICCILVYQTDRILYFEWELIIKFVLKWNREKWLLALYKICNKQKLISWFQ